MADPIKVGRAPVAELAVTRVLEESNTGSVPGIASGLWWLTTAPINKYASLEGARWLRRTSSA